LEIVPQYRFNLFKQIHEIVFHGKGGYTWFDVYNMPTWLRKYTFNEIKTYYDRENEEYQKAKNPNSRNVVDSDGKVSVPDFMKNQKAPPPPSYITKASKK
jgi:hypothetical protein